MNSEADSFYPTGTQDFGDNVMPRPIPAMDGPCASVSQLCRLTNLQKTRAAEDMAAAKEVEDVFEEDFPFQLPNPTDHDPWQPLPSGDCSVDHSTKSKSDFLEMTSERYIASLEARLHRIQGKARDPTPKDLIQGLEKAKDAHMTTLVQSSDMPYISNYIPDKDNVNNPNILQRKLHPEKVAVTSDERKLLVEDDDLAKRKADAAKKIQDNTVANDVSPVADDGKKLESPKKSDRHPKECADHDSCEA